MLKLIKFNNTEELPQSNSKTYVSDIGIQHIHNDNISNYIFVYDGHVRLRRVTKTNVEVIRKDIIYKMESSLTFRINAEQINNNDERFCNISLTSVDETGSNKIERYAEIFEKDGKIFIHYEPFRLV